MVYKTPDDGMPTATFIKAGGKVGGGTQDYWSST
jgi:hypothetical protein